MRMLFENENALICRGGGAIGSAVAEILEQGG